MKDIEIGKVVELKTPHRGHRNVEIKELLQYTYLVELCGSGVEIEVYEDELIIEE